MNMRYIGPNIRFIFTKIKELMNSHNTDNSAHSELFKSWTLLRNPTNAQILDAIATIYKTGFGNVLVDENSGESAKLFFRPSIATVTIPVFGEQTETLKETKGIYITTSGEQGQYIASHTDGTLTLTPAASDAILYTAQTLTEEQKSQARQNIGAVNENLGCNKYNIHVTTTSGTTEDFEYYTTIGEIRQPAEAVDSSIRTAFSSLTSWPAANGISEDIAKTLSKQYKTLYDANYIDSPCCIIKSPTQSDERVQLSYHSFNNIVMVSRTCKDGSYNLNYDVANDALKYFYVANNIRAVNGVVDQLVMSATPTEDMHIATKQYVDNNVNDKLPIYIKMTLTGANSDIIIAEDGTTGSQILNYLIGGREVALIYQGFTYYLSEQGTEAGTTTLTSLSFAACAKNPSDTNSNGDNVLSRITYDFNKDEFSVTTEGRYIDPINGVVKSDLSADIQKTLDNANATAETEVGLIRYIKMVDADTTGSGIIVPDNSDVTYYTIKEYINSGYIVILLYKGVPYSLNYTKVVNNNISLYYFHAIVSSDATSTVDTASEIKTVMAGNNLGFKVTTKPLYISATVSNNTLIIG